MCGRFTNIDRAIILAQKLGLPPVATAPRYNIAPTRDCPVALRRPGGNPEFASLRWGLIPRWAKDASMGARLINARAESVETKPAFREAFRQRRCLVPASGFFEWRRRPAGKGGTPYYFTPVAETDPLVFAGLWERWQGGDGEVRSFTIVTTEANSLIAPIHERMPAILPPESWEAWLDPANRDTEGLLGLLRPAAEGMLRHWEVGPYVNNPRNDGPLCIERVA